MLRTDADAEFETRTDLRAWALFFQAITPGMWHSDCSWRGMMTAIFIVLTLIAAGLIIELIAAARAPFGFEDEDGFHFGFESADRADDYEFGNPS